MLRIIAGQWRGKRFRFPDEAIRPTPDRVRETLYNWLQGKVAGARVLDLYAGSGALGLEALSRGAAEVVFVESEAATARALQELLIAWAAGAGRVERRRAEDFLQRGPARAFDLVLLDPPFESSALADAAARLEAGGWLAAGAHIYIEHSRRTPLPPLPAGWTELRSGKAGEVGYHLFHHAQ
jgi:16S rRNA (guanine966-N2)-methyltransferase